MEHLDNLTPEQRALPKQAIKAAYTRVPMTCDTVREILDEASREIVNEFKIPGEEYAFVDRAISHAFGRIRDEVTVPLRTDQMRLLAKDHGDPPHIQEMGWHHGTVFGSVEYIRVATNNYRRLGWEEIWEKFISLYPGKWAVQFFPPEEELINTANVYHLFVLEEEPRGLNIKGGLVRL